MRTVYIQNENKLHSFQFQVENALVNAVQMVENSFEIETYARINIVLVFCFN